MAREVMLVDLDSPRCENLKSEIKQKGDKNEKA
jgi:hypothetical protein